MAGRKKKTFDRLKVIKALSRKETGRPGSGRKCSFVDRKKKRSTEICRKKLDEEE